MHSNILAHISADPRALIRPARHIIHDSHNNADYYTDEGLAFTIGVAALEAELTADPTRLYQIQHPNGVAIYYVVFLAETRQVVVTKIGA